MNGNVPIDEMEKMILKAAALIGATNKDYARPHGETCINIALARIEPLRDEIDRLRAENAGLKSNMNKSNLQLEAENAALITAEASQRSKKEWYHEEHAKEMLKVISLKAENAALIQTSGELCPVCGWRFVIPGIGCYQCHNEGWAASMSENAGLLKALESMTKEMAEITVKYEDLKRGIRAILIPEERRGK